MNKISVIMPVFNGSKYLHESILSVLNQSYKNFQFIIIDDASTDSSREIIAEYAKKDSRILFLKNESNMKIAQTTNKALKLVNTEYIAFMDQDDISIDTRFELLVKYLDTHKNVDVCGTWFKYFGKISGTVKHPIDNDTIKIGFLFKSTIGNPTTLIRAETIKTHNMQYDPESTDAHDYDFWIRYFDNLVFANLPNVLLKYRVHDNCNSLVNQNTQKLTALKNKKRLLLKLNLSGTLVNKGLNSINKNTLEKTFEDIQNIELLFIKIINNNAKENIFNQEKLIKYLQNEFYWVNFYCCKFGNKVFYLFKNSTLHGYKYLSVKKKIEFKLRCIFKIIN